MRRLAAPVLLLLLRATGVSGHKGNRGEAIPADRLRELLRPAMHP